MTPKAHINPVLILALTVIVLLLAVALAQPVNAGRSVVLRPPFNGTHRVTAYFDHDRPDYDIGDDGFIWIYNGERVTSSYINKTGDPYPYDGHDGWDFSMGSGTDVLAAAPGTVVVSTGINNWDVEPCYGRTIVIDHGNGYYTQYSHLSQTLVLIGNPVAAGQHIAESGDTTGCGQIGAHLHFGVRHGGYNEDIYHHAIDPFGWRGTQRDPLFDYNGKESSCLWAGLPGDSISCADFIVEDDGAGWSQNGAWTQSDAGNGFRQHWTYSWNPPDYWARWTPALPYQGYYQIQAFIPYINATTTNARYEIHQSYATIIVPINQDNISDNWASLGTFFLEPTTNYVQLYDYTGEPNYSKQVAADSIKFSASIVHLPYVRNNQSGWVSSITVRNNSASTAWVAINYYSQSGGRVAYATRIIAGNATETLTPPSGFDGATVVVADQDVSVVVNEQNSTSTELNEYNGILASGGSPGWEQVGSTVYAPFIKNHRNGRSSKIIIANAGTSNTNATVQFYNILSGVPLGTSTSMLAPNASILINSDGCTSVTARCSATMSSSNAQPLAVVVREQDDASTNYRATSVGFSAGATSNFVPLVKKNYGTPSQTTGIVVQNVGTLATTVTVTCYDLNGVSYACGIQSNLSANATVIFGMPANLPDHFLGSAVVSSSGQPIVTLIYETGTPYQQVTNAPLGGTFAAYAPELYGTYSQFGQTWNSGLHIQNVGSTNANITVTYYDQNGVQKWTPQTNSSLGPHLTWILNYNRGNMPGNFMGSAVIQASQPIVGLVSTNHTGSGDTYASYTVSNR